METRNSRPDPWQWSGRLRPLPRRATPQVDRTRSGTGRDACRCL